MANTTWNPSDKGSLLTLSGGNLTAAANIASASGGVRTVHSLTGVKLYFEITLTSLGGGNVFPGVATAAASVSSSPGGVGTSVVTSSTGNIVVNNVGSGTSLGAFSAGQIACVAIDLVGNLIWFRKTASGNWNNNVANNPSTGVGGISVSVLFGSANAFGYSALQTVPNGTPFTANFGDSAFSGVVPSGYIAGFPTVAPATSGQARVMVMA